MNNLFLPSMIEVEFGEYYQKSAELLFDNGFKSFHIDFGDNKLIGRELECWDKVSFLKSLGPEMRLTAHIMSMSGNHKLSVERITDRCLEEGFEVIYFHSRSFNNVKDFSKFKEKIFNDCPYIFGVVSEALNKCDHNLINFVQENSIMNLLQMGVPIGKGGQKFHWSAEDRIEDFVKACPSLSSLEIDGGLTFDVIKNLKKDKINKFAGWSIIYDEDPSKVLSKAFAVNQLI